MSVPDLLCSSSAQVMFCGCLFGLLESRAAPQSCFVFRDFDIVEERKPFILQNFPQLGFVVLIMRFGQSPPEVFLNGIEASVLPSKIHPHNDQF